MDLGIIILGIWALAFIVMFLCLVRAGMKRNDISEEGFDERQTLARGLAFQWGFLAGIVYLFLLQFTAFWDNFPLEQHDTAMIGIVFMVVVYESVAIWKDAFIRLGEKELPAILGCLVFGCCQIAEGISEKFTLTDIVTGVGFVYTAVILFLRRMARKREEQEEGEL